LSIFTKIERLIVEAEDKVFGERKVTQSETTLYAAAADFCRIFERDMNRLYMLSFLLTADHALAEKCFVRGLEDARNGNPVFKEWAESWARRTIIRNAIQLIAPEAAEDRMPASGADEHAVQFLPAELAAVVALPAFERFAFVMSVLERYSEQECSLLLGCSRAEVVAARSRALQQLGTSAEAREGLASVGTSGIRTKDKEKDEMREESSSMNLGHFARLAVPA
jgi:DNA-directed RNA polymerase specialized sigma24 family protein